MILNFGIAHGLIRFTRFIILFLQLGMHNIPITKNLCEANAIREYLEQVT